MSWAIALGNGTKVLYGTFMTLLGTLKFGLHLCNVGSGVWGLDWTLAICLPLLAFYLSLKRLIRGYTLPTPTLFHVLRIVFIMTLPRYQWDFPLQLNPYLFLERSPVPTMNCLCGQKKQTKTVPHLGMRTWISRRDQVRFYLLTVICLATSATLWNLLAPSVASDTSEPCLLWWGWHISTTSLEMEGLVIFPKWPSSKIIRETIQFKGLPMSHGGNDRYSGYLGQTSLDVHVWKHPVVGCHRYIAVWS